MGHVAGTRAVTGRSCAVVFGLCCLAVVVSLSGGCGGAGPTSGPEAALDVNATGTDLPLALAAPVLYRPPLARGLSIGLDTNQQDRDWIREHDGSMECNYPAGRQWGVVFICVGPIEPDPLKRKTRDYWGYRKLQVDLKGAAGNERVSFGVKTQNDPDNGMEPKKTVRLTTAWQTFSVLIHTKLVSSGYPDERFHHLWIPFELVFSGPTGETVFVKNVRYTGKYTGG